MAEILREHVITIVDRSNLARKCRLSLGCNDPNILRKEDTHLPSG